MTNTIDLAEKTSAHLAQDASPSPAQENLITELAVKAEKAFEAVSEPHVEPLQNLIDVLLAKVVGVAFAVFREEFTGLLRLLRSAYGQIARFVKGDFRTHPSFYLGQLYALAEITYRLGHQHVPEEAMKVVLRSDNARNVLRTVVKEKSIGAADLATMLRIEESNLSAICKPLVEQEILRRERFGRRIRYSPTPLSYAIVAQLISKTEQEDEDINALIDFDPKVASGKPALDWPKMAVAAAAASLQPGSNVMANTDDFVGPLLALANVRDADEIAIEPSGRRVRLAGQKRNLSKLDLPKSVSKSLSDQLKACSRFGYTRSNKGKNVVDWNGQKLMIVPGPKGASLKLRFIEKSDPHRSKSKAQVVFKEIQEGKERLTDFEKVYVREVLDSCHWQMDKAADILGIKPLTLNGLMKNLNIEMKPAVTV
jgi:DNA-binding MarR family transcriptional regulator